jgi:beta-phosphoglucomutase-like phosphatase (HAD superfamily)
MRRSRAEENIPMDGKASHGPAQPAILFDLDGTLLDSNYEHVAAWHLALRREGVNIPNAFLHRCIGMRGELLIRAVVKEIGSPIRKPIGRHLEKLHKHYFEKTLSSVQVLVMCRRAR